MERAAGITDTGTVTVGVNLVATTDDNSGLIDLDSTAVTGTVALTTNGTGNATFDNGSLNLDLAASNVGGSLTVTSGEAAGITDSGTVTVGVDLVATTDANNGVIDLGMLAVTGDMDLTTHGTGDVTIVNNGAIDFKASEIGGDLSATASSGDITDTGRLTVGLTSIFKVANNQNITLDSSENAFTGAVTLQANSGNGTFGNITFVDDSAVRINSSGGIL